MTDRERDPWEGYDHWRLGRVRSAPRVNLLLAKRPLLLPAVLAAVGAVLLLVGLLLPAAASSGSGLVRALLFGGGGLLLVLGLGGLFSALLVRLFGAEAKPKDGRRPWV